MSQGTEQLITLVATELIKVGFQKLADHSAKPVEQMTLQEMLEGLKEVRIKHARELIAQGETETAPEG